MTADGIVETIAALALFFLSVACWLSGMAAIAEICAGLSISLAMFIIVVAMFRDSQ